MARTSGKSGHLIMFAVVFAYIAFFVLRSVPSIPIFLRVFNQKWVLKFVKDFSVSIEIIIWFLSFSLLIWFVTLIDLHILKSSCIPGINPTWSWCMILLMCCWSLFASILLRIFASVFIMILACHFLFCVMYLSGFGIRVIMASEQIWEYSSFFHFWEEFKRERC